MAKATKRISRTTASSKTTTRVKPVSVLFPRLNAEARQIIKLHQQALEDEAAVRDAPRRGRTSARRTYSQWCENVAPIRSKFADHVRCVVERIVGVSVDRLMSDRSKIKRATSQDDLLTLAVISYLTLNRHGAVWALTHLLLKAGRVNLSDARVVA
jgi:hypothetical protein